jgi:hypothetical protein
VRSEAATLAPVIRQLISTGLGTLKIALQVATLPLRAFAALLRGLGVIGEDKLTSSVGAAARPASFGGVEDYVKKTYESAFSAGAGKEVELPKVLSKLEIAIDKLLIWLQRAGQGADAGKKVLAGAGSALDLVNPFSPLSGTPTCRTCARPTSSVPSRSAGSTSAPPKQASPTRATISRLSPSPSSSRPTGW